MRHAPSARLPGSQARPRASVQRPNHAKGRPRNSTVTSAPVFVSATTSSGSRARPAAKRADTRPSSTPTT